MSEKLKNMPYVSAGTSNYEEKKEPSTENEWFIRLALKHARVYVSKPFVYDMY